MRSDAIEREQAQVVSRSTAHRRFAAIALVGLLAITLIGDGVARTIFQNVSLVDATLAGLQSWLDHPMRFIFLSLPVVGAHLLAVELARATNLWTGLIGLAGTLALLGALYVWGFLGFYESMALKKWTAATLTIGLLPVYGFALLLVPLVATVVADKARRARQREPRTAA